MFIGEVLFVNEGIVSKLHQKHKDKETPPLLAFPWFGAQFLSHAFLALERDRRFTHITRFLNLADLAPHVSGTGYTFFVPVDSAFEMLGLDKMPDNYLSTGDGLQMLLNHFVKGRLYDRDLKDGIALQTLGNQTIYIKRDDVRSLVNNATIVESEIFVYNLGTMFYINRLLFAENLSLPLTPSMETTAKYEFTTNSEVETIPHEIFENNGKSPDVLLSDADVTDMSVEFPAETTIGGASSGELPSGQLSPSSASSNEASSSKAFFGKALSGKALFDNLSHDNSSYDNSSHDNSPKDNSSHDNSSSGNLSSNKSSSDKPASNKSSLDKPSLDKPFFDNPSFDKSSSDNSSFDKSPLNNSSFDKSSLNKSSFDKSSFDKSSSDKSSLDKSSSGIATLGETSSIEKNSVTTNSIETSSVRTSFETTTAKTTVDASAVQPTSGEIFSVNTSSVITSSIEMTQNTTVQ